eukprot:PITA_02026
MRSKNDPNLYIKEDEGKNVALISVYVDDLIITRNACKLIEEIKIQLSHVFEMKDLREFHYCLGLEVWRESGYSDFDWAGNLYDRKSTTGYVFNIGSGPISWISKKQPTVSLSSTEAEYKALCSATCEAIWLDGTIPSASGKSELSHHYQARYSIFCYSDFDWAGNLDDRKSTTGYVFNIGSGPISWISKKQPTVSLSSTKVKYKALCSATYEAIWLGRILADVGETQQAPTAIRCDNQSTIKLANNLYIMQGQNTLTHNIIL